MKTLDRARLTRNEFDSIHEAAASLKADVPVSRVILFGSKARGTAMPDSDIDLLILTSCPVNMQLREAISERLARINLQNDVDLTSIVASEHEWSEGLLRYALIHSEVERDGCEI
jgi:predicted nucleotidyltransferase